jgi:hypothetical protein
MKIMTRMRKKMEIVSSNTNLGRTVKVEDALNVDVGIVSVFFCKYCGGLEFREEDDGYHEAPCLEGHVSSMSNISAAYEEYFRDQGCEVPACKEKLQKWRQDVQNEAEVKERRRLEQKERNVVMAAEQKSL